MNAKSKARVERFLQTGEGRCTLRELREAVGVTFGPWDYLAEDTSRITEFRGRKVILRDGWVTLAPVSR